MKTVTWCVIGIGILATIAWLAIVFSTLEYLVLFVIAGEWFYVTLLGLAFFVEMLIANYLIFEYHGE